MKLTVTPASDIINSALFERSILAVDNGYIKESKFYFVRVRAEMAECKDMTCFMCDNAYKAQYNGHRGIEQDNGSHECHKRKTEFNAEVAEFKSHGVDSSKERLVSAREVLSMNCTEELAVSVKIELLRLSKNHVPTMA